MLNPKVKLVVALEEGATGEDSGELVILFLALNAGLTLFVKNYHTYVHFSVGLLFSTVFFFFCGTRV
jgi:hypothetical protein